MPQNHSQSLEKNSYIVDNNVMVSKDLQSTIKCHALVMAGDKDGGNPVERVVSAARFIPNHQISIIPNTGHGCHNDNFEATWASIVPFLKDWL